MWKIYMMTWNTHKHTVILVCVNNMSFDLFFKHTRAKTNHLKWIRRDSLHVFLYTHSSIPYSLTLSTYATIRCVCCMHGMAGWSNSNPATRNVFTHTSRFQKPMLHIPKYFTMVTPWSPQFVITTPHMVSKSKPQSKTTLWQRKVFGTG